MGLTTKQQVQIRDEGFLFMPQLLALTSVDAVLTHLEQLWEQEGVAAGQENYVEAHARRLANLADKGEIFRPIFSHRAVIDVCEQIMGSDVRLSMLNARDAVPHSGARQMWHCDTDNSGRPDESGFYSCTAIWMLDDFTEENGATYFVPRTHLTGKVPKDVLSDRYAPHPNEIRVLGKRGDVFIFNGHCWHAGGENRSDKTRRAVLAHYLRADKLPERNDRRQIISAESVVTFSQKQRQLLGLSD